MSRRASKLLYPIFGILLVAGYSWYVASGHDLGAVSTDSRALPAGARQPGGGFRVAPAFWGAGLSGGK